MLFSMLAMAPLVVLIRTFPQTCAQCAPYKSTKIASAAPQMTAGQLCDKWTYPYHIDTCMNLLESACDIHRWVHSELVHVITDNPVPTGSWGVIQDRMACPSDVNSGSCQGSCQLQKQDRQATRSRHPGAPPHPWKLCKIRERMMRMRVLPRPRMSGPCSPACLPLLKSSKGAADRLIMSKASGVVGQSRYHL